MIMDQYFFKVISKDGNFLETPRLILKSGKKMVDSYTVRIQIIRQFKQLINNIPESGSTNISLPEKDEPEINFNAYPSIKTDVSYNKIPGLQGNENREL